MSVSVTFNGTTYLIPTTGETGWDTQLTAFLTDVGNNSTTAAGSQTLSNKILKLQSGSAPSPSLTFQSDATTGVYLPSADQLAFATGGVQALKIDAGQNVTANAALTSTGTLTASATLAVAGTAALASTLTVAGTATVTGTLTASTGITTGTLTATGATSVAALTASGATSLAALTASGAVSGAGFAAMFDSTGRNLIHNSMFRVAQRGTGPFTSSGTYTIDRWAIFSSVSTQSVTQAALSDADRTAIGDEAAEYCFVSVCGGTAGAGDNVQSLQRIEDVKRLSGKTVTISFWAKANTGTPKVGLYLQQLFGTGGSPSSVVSFGSQNFTLSTTWTRYTATIAVPTSIGKTFGTSIGTDYTQLGITQSSGSTNNTLFGGIGVQSYTLSLWGVQLEIGSLATALEKPDFMIDVAQCQRFYNVYAVGALGYNTAGGNVGYNTYFPPMRAAPTGGILNPNYSGASGATVSVASNSTALVYAAATSGPMQWGFTLTLTAEL